MAKKEKIVMASMAFTLGFLIAEEIYREREKKARLMGFVSGLNTKFTLVKQVEKTDKGNENG